MVSPTGRSRLTPSGVELARRDQHLPAEQALGHDDQPPGARVGEQRLGVGGCRPGSRARSVRGLDPVRSPGPTGTDVTETVSRLAVLSPMSPTQTRPARPGGQRLDVDGVGVPPGRRPTVRPVAGSTVNTRASSPESLTVRTGRRGPPARWTRRSRGRRSGAAAAARSSAAGASARGRTGAADHERRPPPHAVPRSPSSSASRGRTSQAATSSSYSSRRRVVARVARPDRAQHRVARRVPALDELHHVDPVALQPQQRGPQRVGQGVGEPLAQDAVADQRRRTAPGGVARRSWAAMSWWQQGAASTSGASHADRARQRVVGRGVAGVQRQHHVGRPGRAPRRRSMPATKSASRPSPAATSLVVVAATARGTSTPVSRTGSPRTSLRNRWAAKVR